MPPKLQPAAVGARAPARRPATRATATRASPAMAGGRLGPPLGRLAARCLPRLFERCGIDLAAGEPRPDQVDRLILVRSPDGHADRPDHEQHNPGDGQHAREHPQPGAARADSAPAQPPPDRGGRPARAHRESREPWRLGQRALPGGAAVVVGGPGTTPGLIDRLDDCRDSGHRKLRAFAEAYTPAWCSMDPARVAAHNAPEGSLTI